MKKGFFIDLHTHGLGPYGTASCDPEGVMKMAALHASRGTGLILPTVCPSDMKQMRAEMKAVGEAMRHCPLIGGINLEGPFLNPRKAGALDKKTFLKPTLSSLRRLTDGFEGLIKIITVAPELPGALRLIERCAAIGIRVNMGHSEATFKEAMDGKRAGATGITHLFNAMSPFHHREPGLAGFGLLDEDIYVEIIPDGAHLSPETLRLVFRMKKPDRIILVSDSVWGAHTGGPALKKSRLTGGGKTIAECSELLRAIGVGARLVEKAGRGNPLEYMAPVARKK